MKKLFTILLLLSAFISNAQNTLDNIGLTSATPASVAYSLRQLSTTYTGPLVRVKVGTSFYDVYPDASTKKFSLSSKISASISTYNAAAAVASANALSTIISGSTDATVAIWYDQSGNGVHVLSSSATAKIITAGSILTMSGQPTINFYGSNSYLTSSTTVNYSSQSNATVNAAAQDVASTNYISGILTTGDNGGWGLCYDPTTTIKGYWVDASGGNGAFSNENSTEPKIITGTIGTPASGTSSAIYVNSSLKGTKAAQNLSNGTTDKIYVGTRGNFAGRQFIGNISETIMFPKTLSASEQSTLESSQSIYLPIPISVTITSSASGTICAGTSVTFTATTTGISSPTYQWFKNGTAITGATSSTYSATTLSNNDQINVIATPGYTSGSISSTNLIANFDAANYNPTSTRWNDLSTSGNHMDFYTSFNYTTLKTATYSSEGGGSLNVNNNNVYGRTINNTGITGNGAKTMSAWIKFDAADRDWTDIANFGSFAGWAQLFEMFGSRNGSGYQILLVYSGSLVAGATTIPLNTWAYITISADGPSLKIYVNGVLDGSGNQALNTVNSPLYLGNSSSTSNFDNLRGKISTLSLWNSALSSQTILDNYNATKGRYAASAGYTSNIITSSINAAPTTPIITINGDACVNKTTLSTTSGLTSYAWYKDNVAISGAISNTYTPSASGAYQVQVSNGSCSSTSTTTTIYSCGRSADGRMIVVDGSTTLVSTEGSVNNGKGVDDSGKILSKPWVYGTVTTRTGRIWLDRNLGASRVATSSTDTQAYGDYYQWGRPADGHEKQIATANPSNFTSTRSATSVPGNNKYIFPIDGSWDWLITPDNTLWTGVNAPNNPCPSGFRIPTESEWAAEAAVFTSQNVAGSYEPGYGLKLTVAGMAGSYNNITAIGNYGQYLTQTAYDNGRVKYFGVISYATWFDTNYYKITGQSVRCIQN